MDRKAFFIIAAILFIAITRFAGAGYAETIPDLRAGWDELWHELMIDIVGIGIVFLLVIIYLLIRYRRRRPGEEGRGPKLSPLAAFGWVAIPAFIFMADDIYLAAKNFSLWNQYRNVPANAMLIDVEGFMWGWDFKYPEGITTTNELRVPVGKPVKLNLTSRDVVHSFFIPDFRQKWDAVKGRQNYLWFSAKTVGEHVITCTEFCGVLHHNMYGKIIAMPENEYNDWIEANKPKTEENKTKGGAL